MQQTKQVAQRCAGGAAARQAGAATKQNASVTAPGAGSLTEERRTDRLRAGDMTIRSTGASASRSSSEGAGSSPTILGLPPGGFATILVDPPWPLQSGEKHYRTMSLARIKALPVGQLAARDAHLWLWTTNALLPKAYEVAEAWGFTVRSPLTWVKFRLGLGGRYQLRNATEQLLFCTRGRAPLGSRSQPTWFNAPVTEHSRKPAEQFAIIERVSPGPYLELFARRRPESNQPWAVWGDQVDSDIRIPGFAVPRYSERVLEAEAETTAKTAEQTESVQTAVAGASRGDDRDDSAGGDDKEALR